VKNCRDRDTTRRAFASRWCGGGMSDASARVRSSIIVALSIKRFGLLFDVPTVHLLLAGPITCGTWFPICEPVEQRFCFLHHHILAGPVANRAFLFGFYVAASHV
jgi:hypothetical protein